MSASWAFLGLFLTLREYGFIHVMPIIGYPFEACHDCYMKLSDSTSNVYYGRFGPLEEDALSKNEQF